MRTWINQEQTLNNAIKYSFQENWYFQSHVQLTEKANGIGSKKKTQVPKKMLSMQLIHDLNWTDEHRQFCI